MLKELRIKNFAVVEDVRLTFDEGLNVLTGSTGAGKSLILSAVNMLRGERANARVIRRGETAALVEAVFTIEQPLAGDLPARESNAGTVTLRREIQESGKSSAFLNGAAVPVKTLALISGRLIEPHGQNEQLRLKSPENHIEYLDMYAGVEDLRAAYAGLLEELREARERLGAFNARIAIAKEKRELVQHRVDEIERARIAQGEKGSLEESLKILEHSQNIIEALGAACERIYEQDSSAVDLIAQSRKLIARLGDLDKAFLEYAAQMEEAQRILETCAGDMRSYVDGMEFDPERCEAMQERLAFFQSLERRHGKTIDEILEEKEQWRRQLDEIDTEDEERGLLEKRIEQIARNLADAAIRLSDKRKKAARTFDERVRKVLASMAMPGVEFETRFGRETDKESPVLEDARPTRLFSHGIDTVEFFIRTNRGERMGPVSDIASSGETSRIALALKEVLSSHTQGSVLIFDELDSGVGADMGDAIAEKLGVLSLRYQIISITHMPQIAARARRHLVVRKRMSAGRTHVDVSEVTGEARREEIARMLGGSKGSEKRLALAAEMLDGKRPEQTSHTMRP